MAYHINILTASGSILNSSLCRPGSAPEYVQRYMTIPAIWQTESVSESRNKKFREIDQEISCKNSISDIKNICQRVECSTNVKGSSTGNCSSKEMAYHINILTASGSILNSSLCRPGSAPEYVQKYMTIPAISHTGPVSESKNVTFGEIDQGKSSELWLHEMKNISEKDENSEKEKESSTGNWSSKEMAYHINILTVSGSILNSSLCRPGSAPEYVQKYMAIPTILHTGPVPKSENERIREIDQKIKLSLREMKYIYQEDECCENVKERLTEPLIQRPRNSLILKNAESKHAKDSIKEVVFVLKILGPNGNVLETSYQHYDQASYFIQQCLIKELQRLSPNNNSWNAEGKLYFKDYVYVGRKSYPECIGANSMTENSDTEISKQAPNDPSRKRLIIIWVICLIVFPKTARASECLESLSTVTSTPSCPTTEKQWTEKALLKGCSTHPQSCSSANQFVYHCLINAFGNATVEVCAPKIRTSYCVEFNSLGARIQANFNSKCTNMTTDCGKFYNSNEMYKVPQCFSSFKEHPIPNNLSETTISHRLQSTKNETETTYSYSTLSPTGDQSYADESSNGAGIQWGKILVGIIITTTLIPVFSLLIIQKMKKLKKSQANFEDAAKTLI